MLRAGDLEGIAPEEGSGQGLLSSNLEAMTEEEAGALAKSLFSVYTSAAEAVYGGCTGVSSVHSAEVAA